MIAGASVSAVSTTYGVTTDERPVSTQMADTQAEALVRAGLLASSVKGTGSLDVFCRQGVVVLAGVVPRGSSAGIEAVKIARATSRVKRVRAYFVSAQPSVMSDFGIKMKIKTALVANPALVAGQVDIGVYAGHVVLVGVAASRELREKFIEDARSVDGVVSVRSFIQVQARNSSDRAGRTLGMLG
jgi:osmotically-inducible protein OsmY